MDIDKLLMGHKIFDFHTHIGFVDNAPCSIDVNQLVYPSVVMSALSTEGTNNMNLDIIEKSKKMKAAYPFWVYNPNEKIVNGCVLNEVFGLKYHASIFRYYPFEDLLLPMYELAIKYSIPILFHCGRDEKSHFVHIYNTAKKYPEIKFVVAHLGGNATHLIMETLNIIKNGVIPNLFFDTSTGRHPMLIEQFVETVGDDRLLFGSDIPYASLELSVFNVLLSKISDESKKKILYKNALKLLKLDSSIIGV